MVFFRVCLLSALCALITSCLGQHNVTVNNTSPSIQYEGNARDAPICRINPDGTLPAGQLGCYLVPSHCTEGVSVGQGSSGVATFSFKGSAIYIESLLNSLSPIYTVTLDGSSTDVDGVRPSAPFVCAPLFSKTGLDPNVEHTVRLSVKGPSPNRNMSIPNSENYFVFSLISYTFTDSGSGDNDTTSINAQAGNTTSSNATSTGAGPVATNDCVPTLRLSIWGAFASILAIAMFWLP